MKPFRLHRRTLLKGAGAALALPTLECMLNGNGTAYAQGMALPKRYVTFYWGNGVLRSTFQPTTTGSTWQLSPSLQPLNPVKSYLNVVTGYDIKTGGTNGHHDGTAGILSGYRYTSGGSSTSPSGSRFGGPSLDQVIAPLIAGDTRFQSLQLAISPAGGGNYKSGEGPTTTYISHKSSNAMLTPIFSPAELYNKLFGTFTPPATGGGAAPTPQVDPRLALRQSVLDLVKDSAKRLQGQVSATDKQRLDAHLTAISEVRTRLQQEIDAASSAMPPPPMTSSCIKPTAVTSSNPPPGSTPFVTTTRLMADLVSLAFACDMTRVASVQLNSSFANTVFREAGISVDHHNGVSHVGSQALVTQAATFVMQLFNILLERLMKTPEGAGNLLDQSCVLGVTELANGYNDDHGVRNHSIVVAGRAGGALKYPGIHARTLGRNTSDVLLTAARAVGANVPSVGGGGGLSSTPCTDIMT